MELAYRDAAEAAWEQRGITMNAYLQSNTECSQEPASGTALGLVVENMVDQMLQAMAGAAASEGWRVTTLALDALYVEKQGGAAAAGLAAACQRAVELDTGVVVEVVYDHMPSTVYSLDVLEGRLPAELVGLGLAPLAGDKDKQLELTLARMLEVVLWDQLRTRLRDPGCREDMYAYRPYTGCWGPVDLKDAAAIMLALYMDWYTSEARRQVPKEYLNAATHEHLLSVKGSTAVLGFLKPALSDPGFIGRLDTAIAVRGMLPFENVCARVDAEKVHLLPHNHEHYRSRTIGYALPLDRSTLDFTEVDRWWATYWQNERKRNAVMMTIAASLLPCLRAKQKQITVDTDKADGNTGKSEMWRVAQGAGQLGVAPSAHLGVRRLRAGGPQWTRRQRAQLPGRAPGVPGRNEGGEEVRHGGAQEARGGRRRVALPHDPFLKNCGLPMDGPAPPPVQQWLLARGG